MQPLDLDRVLTLNPGLRIDRLSGSVIVLIGERQRSLLSARGGTHMMDLVDGRRTVDQIAMPRVPGSRCRRRCTCCSSSPSAAT